MTALLGVPVNELVEVFFSKVEEAVPREVSIEEVIGVFQGLSSQHGSEWLETVQRYRRLEAMPEYFGGGLNIYGNNGLEGGWPCYWLYVILYSCVKCKE